MSRVYGSVDLLQGQPLVGDGECVTLVKRYAHLGSTATWRAGKKVWGTPLFQKVPLLPLFLMGDGLAGVQVIMLHSIWGRINEDLGYGSVENADQNRKTSTQTERRSKL